MSNDVSKLDLHAWMTPPPGAAASKLQEHAWLMPPTGGAVAKVSLHTWLMPMTVGVAKLAMHAWLLPDAPDLPAYDSALSFEGAGQLGVAPRLFFISTIALKGTGHLRMAGVRRIPDFDCRPSAQTSWSSSLTDPTVWGCATSASTNWTPGG